MSHQCTAWRLILRLHHLSIYLLGLSLAAPLGVGEIFELDLFFQVTSRIKNVDFFRYFDERLNNFFVMLTKRLIPDVGKCFL